MLVGLDVDQNALGRRRPNRRAQEQSGCQQHPGQRSDDARETAVVHRTNLPAGSRPCQHERTESAARSRAKNTKRPTPMTFERPKKFRDSAIWAAHGLILGLSDRRSRPADNPLEGPLRRIPRGRGELGIPARVGLVAARRFRHTSRPFLRKSAPRSGKFQTRPVHRMRRAAKTPESDAGSLAADGLQSEPGESCARRGGTGSALPDGIRRLPELVWGELCSARGRVRPAAGHSKQPGPDPQSKSAIWYSRR